MITPNAESYPPTRREVLRGDYIAAAKRLYSTDDVDIDDDARLSECDLGTWVQAWVFVNDEEVR